MKYWFSLTVVLIAVFLCSITAISQITITRADLISSMTNSRFGMMSSVYTYPPRTMYLGNSSTGQTWDFSNIEMYNSVDTTDYISPSGTAGADSFPTANVCQRIYRVYDGGGYRYSVESLNYYQITDDGFYTVGTAARTRYLTAPPPYTPADTTVFYSQSHRTLNLPLPLAHGMSYGTRQESSSEGYYFYRAESFYVAGTGTVRLPGGYSFPALRIIAIRVNRNSSQYGSSGDSSKAIYFLGRDLSVVSTLIGFDSSSDSVQVQFLSAMYRVGTLGVQQTSAGVPETFTLHQNYPNPFNPATTIAFDVAQEGFVTLKVFNTLGQEVAVLANGHFPPGSYTASFDADALPSGMYFYRLSNEAETVTKSMMLVR